MNESMKELSLGQRIAHLRKAQGFTQEALSEMIGVTPQAVSKWENSQSCPDIMTLPHLAKLLNVTIDALLTGEEPAAAPSGQPVRPLEELIVRIMINEQDGNRFNVNLPFVVFKLGARFGMLSITWNGNGGETSAEEKASILASLDFGTMVRMIESGVRGKLVDLDDDGERLVIWTE